MDTKYLIYGLFALEIIAIVIIGFIARRNTRKTNEWAGQLKPGDPVVMNTSDGGNYTGTYVGIDKDAKVIVTLTLPLHRLRKPKI